jgi:hypothetical protein
MGVPPRVLRRRNGVRSRNRINLFSLAALPGSIVIWTAAILASRLSLGGFGLIGGLHPAWYAAVALAVAGMLAAVATRSHSVLLTAYAIAILVMIVATGMLLERGPRFPYIYNSYLFGEQILRTSSIDYTQSYLAWPGWHVATAVAVGASGIDPNVLLTWIPLWLSLATLAGLMTLLRRYRLPRYQRWIAIAIAATTFPSPTYPVPQSIAFILLTFLAAITIEEYVGHTRSARGRIGILVLFAGLVVTHLLTSFVGLAVVVGVSILAVVAYRRRPGPAGVFGAVLISTYLLYVAITVTAALLPQQIDVVLHLDQLFGSIFGATASGVTGGSADHTQVVFVRIGYVVGLTGLGALGGLVAIARRTRLRRWAMPTAWVAAGLASLSAGAYAGEILARGSALAAPGSLALASWLARMRPGRILLGAAILVAALLSPVNLFGSELFDYVRPTEIAADRVLAERHPETWNLVGRGRTWYAETGQAPTGPFVTIYGPLFDVTSAVFSKPEPPPMPFWSYDNGDVRIMVASERTR